MPTQPAARSAEMQSSKSMATGQDHNMNSARRRGLQPGTHQGGWLASIGGGVGAAAGVVEVEVAGSR